MPIDSQGREYVHIPEISEEIRDRVARVQQWRERSAKSDLVLGVPRIVSRNPELYEEVPGEPGSWRLKSIVREKRDKDAKPLGNETICEQELDW